MYCGQIERRMVDREGHETWTIAPRTDIMEMDDHFAIEVEMPGISSDHVDLQVEDDELRLSATRNGKLDGKYLTRERLAGTYTRTFRLGEAIDVDGIQGEMSDGILRIRLPKAARVLPRKIAIGS